MILVTRLNGKKFFINAELIQSVEQTPDTIITLQNNTKLVVQETAEEVAARFIEYRPKVTAGAFGNKSFGSND